MHNVDTDKLRKAIEHYKFYSTPSNSNGSAPCTNQDLKNVITKTADLFKTFLTEIENSD